MIKIVAKRYYIENGHEMKENLLREVIKASFPPFVLTTNSEDELVNNVTAAFSAVSFPLENTCMVLIYRVWQRP